MVIYENTKAGFIKDVTNRTIGDILWKLGASANIDEKTSWVNSSEFTKAVLSDPIFDDDISVYMEYEVRFTEKRVDFMIAGSDDQGNNHVVAVELKQWQECQRTGKDGYVQAATGGRVQIVPHPSFQAHDYIEMIRAFCKNIVDYDIGLHSCAYLHNYRADKLDELTCSLYSDVVRESPVFISGDNEKRKLIDYLSSFVKHKATIDIIETIESSELSPAKSLQDTLVSMLKGNKEFTLFGEQRTIYNSVLNQVITAVNEVRNGNRHKACFIVKGGPGTGKSVVAIQLLVDLISNHRFSACYISKNGAPRNVYSAKLKENRQFAGNFVNSIFKSSGAFTSTRGNTFDCLLADEAHRLNEHSGLYGNQGENQVKEIIHSAKVSVFFIDENQRIATSDIGSVAEIKKWAEAESATVYDGFELLSQFRCNGSDGYLSFVDDLLEINSTRKYDTDFGYEIKVFSDPTRMRMAIELKNTLNNKSRMVAGYCYEWITKSGISPSRFRAIQSYRRSRDVYNDIPVGINADEYDIILSKYGEKKKTFFAKWNFSGTSTWAIDPNSVNEVGCIHTSQGLEFDYCGVIIGNDLRYERGRVITDKTQNANTDGFSGIHKKDTTDAVADELIRNTYKVLLTRGQKGCYIFCEDKALADHILEKLHLTYADNSDDLTPSQKKGLDTLLLGCNCFITGEGGTGKSYLIDRFVSTVQGYKRIMKCAPTGIAAAHIGGQTLFKQFRIPITPSIKTKADVAYGKVIENISKYDIIIIDEISMCRIDLFEYVMRTINAASALKGSPIQIVLCGDFFQLPPVVPEDELPILEQIYGTRDGFAFESDEWKNHDFKVVNLVDNIRQGRDGKASAIEFMKYLNNLRAHREVPETIRYFNEHARHAANDDSTTIEIHATNDMVDQYNVRALDAIHGEEFVYSAEITGTFPAEKYPVAEKIRLKDGAKVMFLINDKNGHYQNGSIGIVDKCMDDGVLVRVNNHREYVIPHSFTVSKDSELNTETGVITQETYDGTFVQLPLRLAYAVTVHKSQGQTFEHVNFDPSGNDKEYLQNGQLYVALSRLKYIEGLYLYSPIKESEWQTSQKVIDFYNENAAPETAPGKQTYALKDIVMIRGTPIAFSTIIKNVRAGIKDNNMTPSADLVYQYLKGTLSVTMKRVYYGFFDQITEDNVKQLYESYVASLEK